MACCSSTKTEQLVSKKAETAKAFAAETKAFLNSRWCLTPEAALPSQRYGSASNWGRSFTHFELRNDFLDFGRLPVEERFMIQTLPPQPE